MAFVGEGKPGEGEEHEAREEVNGLEAEDGLDDVDHSRLRRRRLPRRWNWSAPRRRLRAAMGMA
jgi:hypothetical protein